MIVIKIVVHQTIVIINYNVHLQVMNATAIAVIAQATQHAHHAQMIIIFNI